MRVKRAIVLAAGKGERMHPITLTTPKPLVTINGVRMIDTVIQAIRANGITEIYVVVGYLKEKFEGLEQQYPGLKLVENPWYDTCNNISSLYAVREHLEDVMICEGDYYIYDQTAMDPEFERSGYDVIRVEQETREWTFQLEDGVIVSCSRTGGTCGWELKGVSRWSKEDGALLRKHLELEFEEKRNVQLYWDDIPCFVHQTEYRMGVHEIPAGSIIEVDSVRELIALDDSYCDDLNPPADKV